MRGGRGGKGGRGGRGGRGSMTQDLLRDNLEDLGIDNPYNFSQQTAPPLLYPPISLQTPCTVRDKDLFYIQKMREIKQRFQTSPYMLTHESNEKDIERYSDKYRRNTKDVQLLSCINASEDDISRYVPLELLAGSSLGKRDSTSVIDKANSGGDELSKLQRKRRTDIDLIKLEQQESAGTKRTKKDDDDSDVELDNDNDEDELELEDDYGVDHYASDDAFGGSDDDGEAIF